MVMCCNTVPAPCASVRNQRASVKLPLSPSETLENPAYSANITTGAVSLSLSLTVCHVSKLALEQHIYSEKVSVFKCTTL